MPTPERKRVFILGAGFSKAAGMPDATEITSLLLETELLRNLEDFQHWVRDLLERTLHVNKQGGAEGESVNVEQLFEIAHFDRELFLMQQQLCPYARNSGPGPHRRAESIDHWLWYMEIDLVEVLIKQQERARPDALRDFSEALRSGDTILTFNYDTLVETALTKAKLRWSHGFASEPPADVRVLKLHGSIDWWMFQRGNEFSEKKWTKLFQKSDVDETEYASGSIPTPDDWEYHAVLFRAADLATAQLAYERETCPIFNPACERGLAGLGSHKPLHRLVGSGEVWSKAFDAIMGADEIYVVGWSASPYDTMARFHFASVLNLPESKPKRVVVVDPKVCDQSKNYRPIFGKFEPIGQCVEQVNWAALLGDR